MPTNEAEVPPQRIWIDWPHKQADDAWYWTNGEYANVPYVPASALEDFRRRAIEAVRGLSDNQLSITTICARLEMLPATSEPDNRVVDTVMHRRDCGMSDCFICYGGR